MSKTSNRWIGARMARREDPDLLRGQARFTDDIRLDTPLHLTFLRSPMASGILVEVEIEEALASPGVHAIHLAQDIGRTSPLSVNRVLPLPDPPAFPLLAQSRVEAVGQPIAAVLATGLAEAQDAAELIFAEIEDEDTPPPRPLAQKHWKTGTLDETFAKAALVVEAEIQHPRLAPSPMEPRAIAVAYDRATERATIWHSTQTPHRTRSELAQILGIDADRLHVIAPSVGGAFGMKASLYPEEVFAVWAAFHHRQAVKWTASRSDDFLSATHGRGLTTKGRLALSEEGKFLALSAEIDAPLGHWLPNSGLIPAWNAARILPAGYDIPELDLATTARAENRPAMGIYRGAGRPEANCLIERLIDKAACVSGIDPVELRRRNLLGPMDLPHKTLCGDILDSGDYLGALNRLIERAGYAALLEERDRRRATGELAGIGVAFYLEPSGSGWETARVTLEPDGHVDVLSGSSSQGHGRETAFAQIVADALGVMPADVTVTCGDTDLCPAGIGALASRSTAIGGSAVLAACQEIARRQAEGEPAPLSAEMRYENDGQAWGYGAYLVMAAIDRETGVMTLEQVHAIDDAGTILNPLLVEGQVMGGFAQGFGEAMMEALHFDADGQLLTGSFMDYAMPRATDVPLLKIDKTETPSPMNILGAKGVGEAGTIGAPAAILNAAHDALAPLGVTDLQMPLTPSKIWQAIRAAEKGQT
jgi:carbon-monoxide dehydrogenase large subunit